jgi:hypothetical protein
MNMLTLLRWLASIGLSLAGTWIIILNFWTVVIWHTRRKHHSWVPLLGGFVAFIGVALCPYDPIAKRAWVPLSIDVGFIVMVFVIAGIAGIAKLVSLLLKSRGAGNAR